MLLFLLQDVSYEGLLKLVLNNGPMVTLLTFAVIVLWKRDTAMQKRLEEATDKMNKYLEEDRKEMIMAIQNNTETFQRFTDKLELILEIHKN